MNLRVYNSDDWPPGLGFGKARVRRVSPKRRYTRKCGLSKSTSEYSDKGCPIQQERDADWRRSKVFNSCGQLLSDILSMCFLCYAGRSIISNQGALIDACCTHGIGDSNGARFKKSSSRKLQEYWRDGGKL